MWRKLGRDHRATQGHAVPVSLECGPLTGRGMGLPEKLSVDCVSTLSTCVRPSQAESAKHFGTKLATCSLRCLGDWSPPTAVPWMLTRQGGEDGPEVLAS